MHHRLSYLLPAMLLACDEDTSVIDLSEVYARLDALEEENAVLAAQNESLEQENANQAPPALPCPRPSTRWKTSEVWLTPSHKMRMTSTPMP